MPAQKGNQWWRVRTKHGRDAIFTDPEELLQACYEYFEFTDTKKWYKREAIKGGDMAGQIIEIPIETPYSIEGLCLFLGVNSVYFNHFKKSKTYLENDGFSKVITHIEEIIVKQQFEGATVGTFNPNIIARKLGLSESIDHSNKDGTLRNIQVTITKDGAD
jgi:hypothetical protein